MDEKHCDAVFSCGLMRFRTSDSSDITVSQNAGRIFLFKMQFVVEIRTGMLQFVCRWFSLKKTSIQLNPVIT